MLLVVVTLLCIVSAATANDDVVDMSAPFYGARPPVKQYEMHRRGWHTCHRCGGADRLGAIVDVGDIRTIDDSQVEEVLDAVRAQ